MLMKPPLGTPINRAHPLARGLVGCWLMNEGAGGKIYDLSGNGNNGTFVNETYWTPERRGSALGFDGSNDAVTIPNADSLNPSRITVSAWFKPTTVATGQKVVVQKAFTSHDSPYYQYTIFWFNSAGEPNRYQAVMAINGTVKTTSHYIDTSFPGRWAHLVATYDGSYVRLYVDGLQRATSSLLSGSVSSYDTVLQLAHYPNLSYTSTYSTDCSIDDVRIYNRALTADEVQQLYLNPYAMFEQYPIWRDYVAAAVGNRRRRLLLTRRAA